MKKRRVVFLIVVLVNCLILSGIYSFFMVNGKNDYSVNQKENTYLIGASYMTMNNEFYRIISEEIKARIEVEGDQWILRDPALDSNRQIEQIEDMLQMGIDVLVLTPVDWESLKDVLKKARNQGVKVVVVDSDISDVDLADCTITTDNYAAGKQIGEYYVQQHSQANVLIMTHEAAKSGRDRVQGFSDVVKKYKGIHIVGKLECEGQTEIAMPKMKIAIKEGVQFDSVFCLNDLASVGVIAALEEEGRTDEVEVYGIDASPDSKALIKDGKMCATMAQFPSRIGKEASNVIYNLLNHKKVEKHILISSELVTRDNVDHFSIDRWQ